MKLKTIVVLAASITLGASLFAQEAASKPKRVVDPRFGSWLEEVTMKKHGGRIRKPDTGAGKIAFVNAQDLVGEAAIAEVADKLSSELKIDIEVVSGERVDISNIAIQKKASGGTIAVAFVANESLPALLVCTEGGWALVNVKALGDKAESRAKLEAVRAVAFSCGVGVAPSTAALLGQVSHPADLDIFDKLQLGGDATMKIVTYLRSMGVHPYQTALYDRACQEGWAPQPTNEWQQEIWDRIHTIPDEPLKIKFEKKAP